MLDIKHSREKGTIKCIGLQIIPIIHSRGITYLDMKKTPRCQWNIFKCAIRNCKLTNKYWNLIRI